MSLLTLLSRPATAGAFNPASRFTGTQKGDFWDASDLARMWVDSAGTVPVALNGDLVGKWTGQRNNQSFSQATTASKPSWQSASKSVSFVAKSMDTISAMGISGTGPITMYLRMARNSLAGSNAEYFIIGYQTAGNTQHSIRSHPVTSSVDIITVKDGIGSGNGVTQSALANEFFDIGFSYSGGATCNVFIEGSYAEALNVGSLTNLVDYLQIYSTSQGFAIHKIFVIDEASNAAQFAQLAAWGAV